MKNLPNLIIGGAPKCGTTSLFHWLSVHNNILAANVKETFYFLDKNFWILNKDHNYHKNGIDGYNHFISNDYKDFKYVMDGTTVLLYQDTALNIFSSFSKKPKIIFLLRKPSKRIYSNFKYFVNNKSFLIPNKFKNINFEKYVNLSLENSLNTSNQQFDLSIKHSNYSHYINQWIDAVGRENLFINSLENMKANPKELINDICNWLDLDYSIYNEFSFFKKNKTIIIKNHFLHLIANNLGKLIPNSKIRHAIKRSYHWLNSKNNIESDSDLKIKNQLDQYFSNYESELSDFIDTNFK